MAKYESIKHWADDEKPREKLIKHGKQVLSDAELIGILLGTGVKETSAIDVARALLKLVNGDLMQLARLSVKELCKVHGVGPAKAINIIAALELGSRKDAWQANKDVIIDSSNSVYQFMKGELQDLAFEQFWILTLAQNNKVINKYKISEGGVSGTAVDTKRIFKQALEDLASNIILLHNHPSGNLKPSEQDKALTQKIIAAGKALDIRVLDHVIISNTGYFSFADSDLLKSR